MPSLAVLITGRLTVEALAHCDEQVNSALECGTPLAEMLRAQAEGTRDELKCDCH